MNAKKHKILQPARRPGLVFSEYDKRYPLAAEKLKNEIASVTDIFEVEHIGCTSVPGCAGKGIIDLMALYAEGDLEKTKEILLSIGFCRQGKDFASPWPEDRPMYLGNYDFDGKTFLVYIHVVKRDDDEARRFTAFRERLKKDRGLLKDYCRAKQNIISEGVKDTDEYVKRKNSIIKKILGPDYTLGK